MELRIYNSSFTLSGIMDNATSVRWRRKYYEPGEFEIHCPATEYNIVLTAIGNYIVKPNTKEVGIIEGRVITETDTSGEMTITGRFLSSVYDRRLIKGTQFFNGKCEEIMHSLVKDSKVFYNQRFAELKGYDVTVSFQATYKNVLRYLSRLSRYGNIGFRTTFDFQTRKPVFETYRGIDHSYGQTENSRVIFSSEYNGLNKTEYTEEASAYKNVMYIGGRVDDDGNRVIVTRGNIYTNYMSRREGFFSATDIEKTEDMTDDDYKAALEQRADSKLAECSYAQSVEGDVSPHSNFRYKQDYDLGDIVTVKDDHLGLNKDLRLTEIEEVYEHGDEPTLIPTFGDTLPETTYWGDDDD